MKKRDYINLAVLVGLFLIIVLILTRNEYLYGSKTDWLSQHVRLAEYFRTMFYDTHKLIPNYALNLSGGVNIFNMSYYGFLNPIILISYLLPNVSMLTYIQVSSIIIVIASIILFYIWSKRHLTTNMSFLTTLVFLCATPIIFHSHRHIMFINYMPFLIMALLGVERYFDKHKSGLLVISIFLIIMTSYYYSVGSILSITVYAIYYYLKNYNFELKNFIKDGLKYILRILISIFMASVILIPTLYVILNGRIDTNVNVTLLSSLIPTFNINLVLYGSYSMGFTSIFIVAIIVNLLSKERCEKFLSFVFLSFIVFPVITYLLNGGMYINGKVLIPFVPLGAYFIALGLINLFENKVNRRWIFILLLVISILVFVPHGVNFRLFLLDLLLMIIGIITIKRKYIISFLITTMCIASTITCSFKDELVKKDSFANEAFKQKIYDNINYDGYRTVSSLDGLATINKVYNSKEYKLSNYSSTLNKYYWNFYFKMFDNEEPHRNFLMIGRNQNILFNMLMGSKYMVGKKANMIGYEKVKEGLFKNDYVLPIGFATDNIMSLDDFNKLSYPNNLQALLENIIVDGNYDSDFKSDFSESKINFEVISRDKLSIRKSDDSYEINSGSGLLKLKFDKKYDEQLTIIKFDVADQNCKDGDLSITINDIKNVLTCSNWRYYNGNNSFTYVVDSDNLNIKFSKGNFNIKNIEFYTLDFNDIKDINKKIDGLIIDTNKTKGDSIFGSIDVKNDGYFMFTIPYDSGYEIKVDNKKIDYELVDTAFIGFKINKGKHDISVTYRTPYLKCGKIVSSLGFIMLIILLIYERKRK